MAVKIPASPAELEEMLQDKAVAKELWDGGPAALAELVSGYARGQMEAKGGELAKQIDAAAQHGMAEFLRESRETGAAPVAFGGKTPRGLTAEQGRAARAQSLYNRAAPGSALNDLEQARSWGEFLKASWHRSERNSAFDGFRTAVRNAGMSERIPSEGGFLVPETLRSDMLMLALETAIVRPRARVIPMTSLRLPYPTIDDPSHATSVYGGVQGTWTEEAGDISAGESSPTFGRVVLEARKLTGYTEIPNELLEDSIEALDQFFREMYPEALAFFEDQAFLTGDGIARPQGILNASCAVKVTRTTSSEVQFADIAAIYPRMLPQSLRRAVWVCSPDVIGQLLQLVLVSGSTPVAPPLWLSTANNAHGGVDYTLLGRPVIVSEKVPALGSTGDISFIDFGYYLIGDRQAMQVASSEEYKFANDLTAFRVIERVDGKAWLRSALTPANGSANTLSPVVELN